ncbi:MAG: glycosyltransferase [Bacteroidetes bacterium]|jgi:glycosyltransferase involved in cell wall biosynthesis|nr:glycosyltransferase [Bacteroidota bacterium]
MKKRRILYSIPNFDTAGSGKVVYDLIQGIDKNRFEPEILVKNTKGAFYKKIESLGVPIHIFPYETEYKPLLTFPFRLWKVVKFFKKHNWDLIHSWHWSSDFSEPLAAKLAGIKFIYTKKAMGWGNKAWRYRSKLSTKVIAINESMMEEFFPADSKINAVYMPLGLDTDEYAPQPKSEKIISEYQISPQDFVVISVVNMVPVKGIEILTEAMIRSQISDWKLFLVGDDRTDYVKNLKEKYKDNSNIIFTGKQMNVQEYLSVADVFVIPTKNEGKREGMPMAPVEAMAMEIPVLGSRVAGIVDILKGFEENIFESENVSELSMLLEKYAQMSEANRKEIGRKMREKVVRQYSYEKFIKSREALYESL